MDWAPLQRQCVRLYGVPVFVDRGVDGSATIRGIFRDQGRSIDPGTQQEVFSPHPEGHFIQSDLPGQDIQQDDLVRFGTTDYRVIEHLQDGEGMVVCQLRLDP